MKKVERKTAPWWCIVLVAPMLAWEWFWNAADQWSPFVKGLVTGVFGTLSALVFLCAMAMFSY